MASTAVNTVSSQTSPQTPLTSAYDKLDTETFTKLLVAELQNQDPMSPMDSAQIVQQVSEIRSIQASTKLNTTLEAVLLGQNVATASSLIGHTISGLTEDSKQITGRVDRVSVADGVAKLHIGDSTVELKNVSDISTPAGS
jgi:flagellar basal-body rod modification protein FlgD